MVCETVSVHFLCLFIKGVLGWVPKITMLKLVKKHRK